MDVEEAILFVEGKLLDFTFDSLEEQEDEILLRVDDNFARVDYLLDVEIIRVHDAHNVEFRGRFLDEGEHTIRLLEHFADNRHIVRVLRGPEKRFVSLRNLSWVEVKYLDALVNRRQGFVLLDVFVKVGILDERIHELDGLQRFLEVPRRVEDAEFYRADFLDGNAVEPIADMPAVGAIAENLGGSFRACRPQARASLRPRWE